MKTFLRFSLPFILVIGLFTACRKDPEAPQSPTGPSGNFTARIANVDWSAEEYSAFLSSDKIILEGKTESGRTLRMEIAGTKAGTYAVNKNTASKAYFTDSTYSGIKAYTSQVPDTGDFGGTITVEKVDETSHTVSGSFKLNLIDTAGHYVVVENGKFSDLLYAPQSIEEEICLGFLHSNNTVRLGKLILVGDSIVDIKDVRFEYNSNSYSNGLAAYQPNTGQYFCSEAFHYNYLNRTELAQVKVHSPVLYQGKLYGIRKDDTYLTVIDPVSGTNPIHDFGSREFYWSSASTDSSILMINGGQELVCYNPITQVESRYPLNHSYQGLASYKDNKILAIYENRVNGVLKSLNIDEISIENSQLVYKPLISAGFAHPGAYTMIYNKVSNKLYYSDAGEGALANDFYGLFEVNLNTMTCRELKIKGRGVSGLAPLH